MSRLSEAAVPLLALALAACGGGGGGGTPTEPPAPPPGIAFSPQNAPGPTAVTLAASPQSNSSTLILEVRVSGVTDLYGVAYDLSFPSSALQFVRAMPGPLLTNGTVQAAVSNPGRLVVGGTLLGQVQGISGSGVLMTLELSAVASGEGNLTFSAEKAVSSNGSAIAGLEWAGGSVRVTR